MGNKDFKHGGLGTGAPTKAKVFILGGGIAGLSAAHELAKFDDFEVHVFDKEPAFGGKAVSRRLPFFSDPDPAAGADREPDAKTVGYASEHGFRLFPHFYRHLTQTLKEIPFNKDTRPGLTPRVLGNPIAPGQAQKKGGRLPNSEGNVWGNLVGSTEAAYARGGAINVVQRPFPASVLDFVSVVREMMGRDNIVNDTDVAYYALRILKFMTSCPERRDEEYERLTWGEYLGVGQGIYSKQFEKLTRSVPRILSAMRADTCSARSVGHSTIQLLFDFVGDGGTHMESVLMGPTQEMWLDPWVRYLKAQGVTFWGDSTLQHFEFEDGFVTGAHVEIRKDGEKFTPDYQAMKVAPPKDWEPVGGTMVRRVRCDGSGVRQDSYFIAALPLEVMQGLFANYTKDNCDNEHPHRKMFLFDYSLQQMMKIERGVAPMVGIQFYLTKDVPICNGHVFYPDAPWALTSVSQAQFWEKQLPGYLSDYLGDPIASELASAPLVKGILSVIISEWEIEADARPEFGIRDPAWNIEGKNPKDPNVDRRKIERARKGLAARFLTEAEIKREVWAQLKDALNTPGKRELLDDSFLWTANLRPRAQFETHYDGATSAKEREGNDAFPEQKRDTIHAAWLDTVLQQSAILDRNVIPKECPKNPRALVPFVWPTKQEQDRNVAVFESNDDDEVSFNKPARGNTPLFMHPKGAYAFRPDAELRIPNLLLASDWVRTYTDLATMEAANEAAKRAVLAILRREVLSTNGFPELHPLTEGRWFEAAKAIDRMLFTMGKQPHIMDTPHLFAMLGGSAAQSVAQAGLDFLGIKRQAPPEMARRPASLGAVGAAMKALSNAQDAWSALKAFVHK